MKILIYMLSILHLYDNQLYSEDVCQCVKDMSIRLFESCLEVNRFFRSFLNGVHKHDFIESCEAQLASAITVFYNLSPGFENMHRT